MPSFWDDPQLWSDPDRTWSGTTDTSTPPPPTPPGTALLYDEPTNYWNNPNATWSGGLFAPPVVVPPDVPGMLEPGTDRIQILAYDLNTQQFTGELAYSSFSWTEAISSPGSFDCNLIPGTGSAALCDPGRTVIYALLGSRILWGGIVWEGPAWTGGNPPQIRVGGSGWWSYYREGRRTIRTTLTFTAEEQFAVVQSILTYAHSVTPLANPLRLTVRPHPPSSSTHRTRTFEATERKPIGESIEELAQAKGGFEFLPVTEWDTTVTPHRPKHFLDLWAPRLGRVTPIVWTHGGDIIVTSHDRSGSKLATHIDAIGSGSGTSKTIKSADITNGYPLIERQVTFSDTNSSSFLTDQADAELARTAEPQRVASVRLLRTQKWPLGSWITGDEIWLSAHDTDLDVEDYYRIQGYKAQVGPTGQLDVQVDFALGSALGRPLTSPARRLPSETKQLLRRLETLERNL